VIHQAPVCPSFRSAHAARLAERVAVVNKRFLTPFNPF
jgi:hypothetical protein